MLISFFVEIGRETSPLCVRAACVLSPACCTEDNSEAVSLGPQSSLLRGLQRHLELCGSHALSHGSGLDYIDSVCQEILYQVNDCMVLRERETWEEDKKDECILLSLLGFDDV